MTPIAQTSAFESYFFPIQTSGGIKYGVPHFVEAKSSTLERALDIPKSPSFKTPFLINIFCVLISL
jgi:hypothetical protein